MELGIKKTGLSALAIAVGTAALGLGSGIFTLEESMLLITAAATTSNAVFNYIEG